ncbi:MAG: hypothetical protein ABIG37_02470 [Nanoarchaeota archaeon]|nr:hypothetical protein [Nanoarchaeota archaeon]
MTQNNILYSGSFNRHVLLEAGLKVSMLRTYQLIIDNNGERKHLIVRGKDLERELNKLREFSGVIEGPLQEE